MLNPFVRGSVGFEETAKVLASSEPTFAWYHQEVRQRPHVPAVGPWYQHARLKTEFDRFGRKHFFGFGAFDALHFCFAWQPLETKSNQIFGMQNTEDAVFRHALFSEKHSRKPFRNSECKTSLLCQGVVCATPYALVADVVAGLNTLMVLIHVAGIMQVGANRVK